MVRAVPNGIRIAAYAFVALTMLLLLAPLVVNRKGLYTDLAKWARGKGFEQLCSSHAECAPGFACAQEFSGYLHCIQYCTTNAQCQGLYYCLGQFNPALYAGGTKLSYCF